MASTSLLARPRCYHVILLLSLLLCSLDRVNAAAAAVCNNSPLLCDRTYSNITHLGAHDSPYVSDASNSFSMSGNQFYNTIVQLDAGVRLVTGQIQNSSQDLSELHLCHTSCDLFDAGTVTSWLGGIKSWLDRNTNDVVTILIVNGAGADATTLNSYFTRTGLSNYAWSPTTTTVPLAPASWPSLSNMISANKRLVVFIDSLPSPIPAASYLLPEFSYVFENKYEVTTATGFSCTPDRPSSVASSGQTANYLFLQNHFLAQPLGQGALSSILIPNQNASSTTNSPDVAIPGSLGAAANSCAAVYGRAPNFLLVDWFDRGPAIATVDRLNGVTGNVSGRRSVDSKSPTTVVCTGQSCGGSTGTVGASSAVKMRLGFWQWPVYLSLLIPLFV